MARKKKFSPIDYSEKFEYRAYYDPLTEQVIAVTNTPHHEYKHFALITQEEFIDVTNHKLKFSDLIVDRFVSPAGSVEARILTKQISKEFNFTSKSLVWVKPSVGEHTEFTITWNKDSWDFHVTPAGREILIGAMYDSTLVFFATLETDFDFLIRTFYIRLHDVLKANILTFPFDSKLEQDIKSINITTRKFFNSYGLIIND